MPTPRIRRGLAAALALGAFTAAAPAVASAATVSVTGDDGNPIAIAPGAPPTIRNMKPDVSVAFPPGEGRYKLTITNAAGAAAGTGADCYSHGVLGPYSTNYTGNGAYTVTLTNYGADDYKCLTPLSTETAGFTIAASTSVTAPGFLLLRAPGSFDINPLNISVAQNPGASSIQVHYGANAVLGADGGITSNFKETSSDPAGAVRLSPDGPGVYTVVARPTRYTSAGEIGGPWSPPVKVVVAAPFDIQGSLSFLDSRGPSYSVRVKLRERAATGRVNVALARGTKSGKYRSLGTAKISSIGTISKRFTARRAGSYRLRLKYKGNSVIVGGSVVFKIRVTRRVIFG